MEYESQHRRIWEALVNLPEGKRIKKDELMEATGVTDDRRFYSIVEDLRKDGYQIGASKHVSNPGYFVKRTDKEIWDYHFATINALHREIDHVRANTKAGLIEKHGESFDFDMEELREDLKRNRQEPAKEMDQDGEGDAENGSY